MVGFVEILLYLVHLGTFDSKRRRKSTVLNLHIFPSSIKEFILWLSKCFLIVIYLPFTCEKDAKKRSSGRKMDRKVHFSVGNLTYVLTIVSWHLTKFRYSYVLILMISSTSVQFNDDLVVARPDIYQVALGSDAEFIVLASDGLWDYMSRLIAFAWSSIISATLFGSSENNYLHNIATLAAQMQFLLWGSNYGNMETHRYI